MAGFRLRRHRLHPRGWPGFPELAESCTGLHAQVLGSAELHGWARSDSLTAGDLGRALWRERSVVKTWCMQGTLHVLTPDQYWRYAAAHTLTPWNPAWLRMMGLTEAGVERLLAQIRELVRGRSVTRRQVGAALGIEMSSWGGIMGPAARRGIVVFGPGSGAEKRFVSAEEWIGPRPAHDPEEARAGWLRRYLGAYGPASKQDFGRWLGTRTVAWANRAFAALADELIEVEVAGRRLWALAADLPELTTEGDLPLRLLPAFDCFVLGHADREHLLAPARRAAVYRTAGWVSPTLLAAGAIAGTWRHALAARRVEVAVTPFSRLGATERRGVRAEVERLGAFLGMEPALSYT